MDDTTQSRTSDVAASAATRKRRSSILKNQRPPRTPFCELEFNVGTPTDTSKSRRVSFSRRTGVAEFATNEATTTWKNFYEEHNKSLESSGNDSGMNHGKQPVPHLGKRIFDQQFEEVEAFDCMGTLKPGINISSSINNINFAQLECTETKLTAPQSNFEVSALTETQSKLFGDNLAITCLGEGSGCIDINFSTTQQIGEKDDLDEIQKDLQRHSNMICQGLFTGQNVSEYIEVDLNMTHVAVSNDESDMSITSTIHSPVSKSCTIDKKNSIGNKDWVTDKENIILNPYIAPRESINFAVNEKPEEVLVFDGKRLIVETEKPKLENCRQSVVSNPSERVPQRKTIVLNCNDDLPNFFGEAQVSKNQSCFLEVSEMKRSCILEDKPAHHHLDEMQNKQRTLILGDDLDDISLTQAVPNVPIITDVEKRRTLVYDDEVGNISITQTLPSNIMDKEKRRTIVYENDNANISITQAVPTNVIIPNENNEKTKTIVFKNEACNISMTQAIPTNILPENTTKRRIIVLEDGTANVSVSQSISNTKKDSKESRRTVVCEDNTGNISVTHSVTSSSSNENVVVKMPERRTTVVFESDIGNISVTQALPSNIILPQNVITPAYGNDANIFMTQALPANILPENNIDPNRRRTVVYEDDTGNLSITQAVAKNQVIQGLAHQSHVTVEPNDVEVAANTVSHANSNFYNGRTIFDSNSADVSNTQGPCANQEPKQEKLSNPEETGNKRRTIVFQNDDADISITQAVPIRQVIDNINAQNQKDVDANIEAFGDAFNTDNNSTNKRRTVVFENNDADISLTQAVPMNQVINMINEQKQNDDFINQDPKAFRLDVSKKSINQVIDTLQKENHNLEATNMVILKEESTNKRRTVVFDNNDGDISTTQAVPMKKVFDAIQKENQNIEASNAAPHQEFNHKRRTVVFDNNDADISITQAVPMNKVFDAIQKENQNIEASNAVSHQEFNHKRRTVVFDNDAADISMTQAVPMNKVFDAIRKDNQNIEASDAASHQEFNHKRRTVVFDNNDADISMTQAVPMNQVFDAIQKENLNIEVSNAASHQEFNHKRRTVVFDSDDADISMTQAVSMIKVIETIQKNNYNLERTEVAMRIEEIIDKRRTVVFENDEAVISMTQADPMNQAIDTNQKENQEIEATNVALHPVLNSKRTVIKNDDTEISTTQSVSLNQALHKQKDKTKHNVMQNQPEIVKSETLRHDNATNNKTPYIVYDDDEGDIAMTRAVSSSIILPDGQEKKRTIVIENVESLLENKDLFIEIDRLTDDMNEIKSSEKTSKEEYDISMSDFYNMEMSGKKATDYDSNDVRIANTVRENFIPNKQDITRIVKIEEQAVMLSKPIPAALATFQQEAIDKSHCKDPIKHDGTLPNVLSDILIYQSLTSNAQNILARTDKGDSQNTNEEDKIAREENIDSLQSIHIINSEVKTPKQEQLNAQSESNHIELVAETNRNHCAMKMADSKQNDSILNDLLDMSQSSFEGTEDKDIMPQIYSVHEATANVNQAETKNSIDTMFYITKDSDEDLPIDKSNPNSNTQQMGRIQAETTLSIEYKDDDDPPAIRDLQARLSTIKTAMREDHVPQFKSSEHYKLDEDTDSKVSLDMSRRKSSKSFKMANDTNELLEMLSDFTDKRLSRLPMEELKDNEDIPESRSDNEDIPESRLSLENKVEPSKPELSRFSRILKRQSMVLSREDLMNNLSMASAALQKSRSDFDDSDSIEEVKETPNVSKDQRKSVRLSTDVVKTLQFEDDSISEKSESVQTPLKKTAFGEISYMKETKSRVIPGFMNNISDGIKELMDDLVKPMSEVQPFNKSPLNRCLKKNPSTCSTQIQANLLTSSQIDLHTELYSTTDSVSDMNKFSSADIITDAVNRSMSRALRSPEKSTPVFSQSTKSSQMDVTSDDIEDKSLKTTAQTLPVSSRRQLGSVLIFDHHNPLNNVLLVPTPPHAIDIHGYDPIKLTEELNQEADVMEKQEVMNQYRMELSTAMINNANLDKTDTQSISSNTSKPMSIDQCTEPENCNVRDMEINTAITMKGNEELLEVSSSLTLVDDELNRNNTNLRTNMSRTDTANSPVTVIYKVEEPPLQKMDSDCTSTDELDRPLKPKKRVYSPTKREKHKQCTLSSLDLTPKPIQKMQKLSTSPESTILPAEDDESPENREKSPVRQKSPRRMRSKKPGTTITVQQLMTMVHVEPSQGEDGQVQERTDSSTTEPRSASEVLGLATSSEIMSSFTSSNNLRDETSLGRSSISGNPSKVEWVPTSNSHLMVGSIDSSNDIVGIIDAMPFMGSHDCQWECVAGSVWTLLLLHSRLRLTVRFASTPRLRPDTPVLNIELETLHQDKKNPIAYLCVMFAAELMRHYMSRGCAAASAVGKLVRRLAGAARLAAQWARAMHDARARLAYSLTHDGWLVLKVANTSFRTVWEVSMRLELVVEHAGAAPWPRACGVRVTRVLAAAGGAPPPDVSRATATTPRDWGHAPRTIWKVFRYLKHKKRDDDGVLHL